MALLSGWPTLADDTGAGQDGTVLAKARFDEIKASVEDQVHSSTNPTIKPNATIDEVVTARGSMGSLDARLDVALNEDGTPKAVAGQAAIADIQAAYGAENWPGNDDFQVWPDGDAAAPIYWVLSGAAASIARTGTGLGDTQRKIGDFAAKVTRAAADAALTQTLLSTSSFPRADHLKGRKIAFGCWVRSNTANQARVVLNDGVATTATSYHAGDGAWTFLGGVHTINSSATKLELILQVNNSSGDSWFSGATAFQGDSAPSREGACPVAYGFIQWEIPGTLANATDARRSAFHRAGIIKDIQGYLKTAGTTANIDVLTNTSTAPVFASALAATLAFATSKYVNGQPGSGTYERRCLRGVFGTSPGNSSLLSLDISNVAGAPADLSVAVRIMVYARPMERFLAFNE